MVILAKFDREKGLAQNKDVILALSTDGLDHRLTATPLFGINVEMDGH